MSLNIFENHFVLKNVVQKIHFYIFFILITWMLVIVLFDYSYLMVYLIHSFLESSSIHFMLCYVCFILFVSGLFRFSSFACCLASMATTSWTRDRASGLPLILLGAGWQPGFSTNQAVITAPHPRPVVPR